jgi:hypothetical protein
MIDIPKEQVQSKKVIGHIKGDKGKVIEVRLVGGLHMVVSANGPKVEVLGVGPHRSISRYIAEKKEPDIEWTELSKSDYVDPALFAFVLPKYEELTDAFISAMEG